MRALSVAVMALVMIGAATMAAPTLAHARFGAGAIADAVADLSVAQPAQYRQRAYRRTYPPRTYTPPQYDTVSPYRYPGSRGALDSCSFC
jgi:hypothetical protein